MIRQVLTPIIAAFAFASFNHAAAQEQSQVAECKIPGGSLGDGAYASYTLRNTGLAEIRIRFPVANIQSRNVALKDGLDPFFELFLSRDSNGDYTYYDPTIFLGDVSAAASGEFVAAWKVRYVLGELTKDPDRAAINFRGMTPYQDYPSRVGGSAADSAGEFVARAKAQEEMAYLLSARDAPDQRLVAVIDAEKLARYIDAMEQQDAYMRQFAQNGECVPVDRGF